MYTNVRGSKSSRFPLIDKFKENDQDMEPDNQSLNGNGTSKLVGELWLIEHMQGVIKRFQEEQVDFEVESIPRGAQCTKQKQNIIDMEKRITMIVND